jgi:hypothetical protein
MASRAAVRRTIIGKQGIWQNFINLFDDDVKIDFAVFNVSADKLRENGGVFPIYKRFQRVITTRDGSALVADYGLTAEISASTRVLVVTGSSGARGSTRRRLRRARRRRARPRPTAQATRAREHQRAG